MKTTLNEIMSYRPCASRWKNLLAGLGKTKPDDDPLSIATILHSNGLNDALWSLRVFEGHEREIRLYAIWCARQVEHLMTDPRSVAALDVAEKYANGQATEHELAVAWSAARDAVRPTVRSAAEDAAWAATRCAAVGEVRNAVEDVAWSAARAAAEAAAEAAVDGMSEGAARSTAWDAAWDAAWETARAAQANELRRICAAIEAEATGRGATFSSLLTPGWGSPLRGQGGSQVGLVGCPLRGQEGGCAPQGAPGGSSPQGGKGWNS